MFQTIMVATGDSPWSHNAVQYAIGLAASLQRELIIAHILNDGQLHHVPDSDTVDLKLREQIEAAGHDILARAVQVAQPTQLVFRTVLQWGDVSERIVKIALDAQCHLIVMGTRHLSGDKRLMAGHICNAVIATSPCPVLVVPLVQLGRPGRFG